MPVDLDLEGLFPSGRDGDVEIARIGRDALDRAFLAPEIAGDDAHLGAVVVDDLRNVLRLDVLIARLGHLQRARQVSPELEAVHPALRVTTRHLLVHDAGAGRHPLDIAGAEHALIAEAVAVIDFAGENISDGLDAAMRMPRKTGRILIRIVVTEIVEQQERVEFLGVAETEGAAQMHACAFESGARLRDALHGTDGHDVCLSGIAP